MYFSLENLIGIRFSMLADTELIKYSHMHGDITSHANEATPCWSDGQAVSMENFQFFELKYTTFLSEKITNEVALVGIDKGYLQ